MELKSAKLFLSRHYPLLGILLGSFLVAISMGTYTNWDSALEYEVAKNILTSGFPYLEDGYMINQPPLGFYLSASIFRLFHLSYLTGVYFSTVFGLGTVVLVYILGTLMYGSKTGVVASGLFGLIPWHVYMSRILLIDNQCLFWSLLFLVFGILAVKRNSQKIVALAGLFFALALLTKLFAVFFLIPMMIIILLYRKRRNFKLSPKNLLVFLLPTLISQVFWYGGLAHQNFEAVYFSSDLYHPVLVDASLGYLSTTYVNSAGYALFLAMFVSLFLSLVYWKPLAKYLRMDVACIAMIAGVSGINLLLVLVFHLTVPYVSVFKYAYSALPFFCLLAGSVTDKATSIIGSLNWKKKLDWVKAALVVSGFFLIFVSFIESINFLNIWVIYASFGIDSVTYYPFNLYTDTAYPGLVTLMHYAGLVLVVISMLVPAVFSRSLTFFRKQIYSV